MISGCTYSKTRLSISMRTFIWSIRELVFRIVMKSQKSSKETYGSSSSSIPTTSIPADITNSKSKKSSQILRNGSPSIENSPPRCLRKPARIFLPSSSTSCLMTLFLPFSCPLTKKKKAIFPTLFTRAGSTPRHSAGSSLETYTTC